MYDDRLIKLVEARRELYDTTYPAYDDRAKRDLAWLQIGDAMNQSALDCKDKWRRIRDNYRRAVKLRKIKMDRGDKDIKRPKYDHILSFLNPYINNEMETSSELPVASPETSNDECSIVEGEGGGIITSETSTQNHPPYKEKFKDVVVAPDPSPTHSHSSFQAAAYPTNPEINSTPQTKGDKIMDFFRNLGETVKDFPEDVQIRVKREIFKIVSDAEEFVCRNNSQEQIVLMEFVKEEPGFTH